MAAGTCAYRDLFYQSHPVWCIHLGKFLFREWSLFMGRAVPSGGTAEIENVTAWAIFYVFNFSSATRERFSNVYTFLASLAIWSKKGHTGF